MKNNHGENKFYRCGKIYAGGLLTFALVAFVWFVQSAALRSNASAAFDTSARPAALGRLAFERLNYTTTGIGYISLLDVSSDGASSRTLAAATVPPLLCSEPAYSPNGAKIAYDQDTDIYVMNADGSGKTNLTNNGFSISERNPSWSAANKIAYERASQIWTMNPDGSNQAAFTAITQPSPLTPAWSPDGSKLAFSSNGDVWVINADGTNERRVTTAGVDPAWSPDSAKIIFGRAGVGIITVNLDGTNQTNLTNGTQDGKPAWSNDGTRIAFVRRDGSNGGIFTMDANGANLTRIIADQATQPGRNDNDNPAWQPVRAAPRTQFDFDADGKSDLSVFRPSNGYWYLQRSFSGFTAVQFGTSTDRLAPADYDGDGKTDIAVWREGSLSYFYILSSLTNTYRFEQFGRTGDLPLPGDWDGDGKVDLAIVRRGAIAGESNLFYYRPSSQPGVDFKVIYWGTGGDEIVYGDFDGDAKNDAAVFRPSNGTWYISRSSDNQTQSLPFGLSGDRPVPADYDGDGKTDIAVWRPSNGVWYLQQSTAGFANTAFGITSDLPAPADFDGDGKADLGIFRPSTGAWYLQRSTSGFTQIQFGADGDKPVPAAFVQ